MRHNVKFYFVSRWTHAFSAFQLSFTMDNSTEDILHEMDIPKSDMDHAL